MEGLPPPPIFITREPVQTGTDQEDPVVTPVATSLALPSIDIGPQIPWSPLTEPAAAPETETNSGSAVSQSSPISITSLSNLIIADAPDDGLPLNPVTVTPNGEPPIDHTTVTPGDELPIDPTTVTPDELPIDPTTVIPNGESPTNHTTTTPCDELPVDPMTVTPNELPVDPTTTPTSGKPPAGHTTVTPGEELSVDLTTITLNELTIDRTTATPNGEPPINPTTLTPDDTFNFPDGNMEVLCGDTVFCVHTSILSRLSPVLHQMLGQQWQNHQIVARVFCPQIQQPISLHF